MECLSRQITQTTQHRSGMDHLRSDHKQCRRLGLWRQRQQQPGLHRVHGDANHWKESSSSIQWHEPKTQAQRSRYCPLQPTQLPSTERAQLTYNALEGGTDRELKAFGFICRLTVECRCISEGQRTDWGHPG